MESEAFIISENICIPTSRRARAGWLARAGFYDFGSPSIATTAFYSRQLAPGQADFQDRSPTSSASCLLQRMVFQGVALSEA